MTWQGAFTAAASTLAVLLVVCHYRNQFPVALLHPRIREIRAQFVDEVVRLLGCPPKPQLKCPHGFFDDLVRPAGQKHPLFEQPQKGVTNSGLNQNTCIQNRREVRVHFSSGWINVRSEERVVWKEGRS